jgi:Tfp pilus assembly protein PilO
MTNLQKRNTTVAAALIVMTIAIYNWFVTPHSQYLMAEQQYQQTIKSLETKNKILNSSLKVSNHTLENLRGKYEQHKQLFFDANNSKDFLADIQTTAEKNGCMIQNIRFLPPRQFPQTAGNIEISQHQTNLNVFGGYGSIVKFLNTLQNRAQRVQVDSLNIEMNNENGYLECDLSISIYTLKVKENTENVTK